MSFFVVGMVMCFPLASACWTHYAPSPEAPAVLEKQVNYSPRVDAFYSVQKRKFYGTKVNEWLVQSSLAYTSADSFALENVAYFQSAREAFSMSSRMESQLSEHGFGVMPYSAQPSAYSAGFSTIYYDIYEADLPVFVSVDAILHAFHRSFDELMQYAEEAYVYTTLQWLLAGMLNQLNPESPSEHDAMLYLAVPYLLLTNDYIYSESDPPSVELPADVVIEADEIIQLITGESTVKFDFFGMPSQFDFSVFYPRGHYGESYALSLLFRAMVWLNRMPLLMHTATPTEASTRHQNMVQTLLKALSHPLEKKRYTAINQFYSRLIGNDNTVNMQALLHDCQHQQLNICASNPLAFKKVINELAKKSSTANATTDDANMILKFFPTKFEYTAWITEQTTQSGTHPHTSLNGNRMASPFDVAYVLGADRSAYWLREELTNNLSAQDSENLVAALQAARKTLLQLRPSEVSDTPIGDWLEALMHASKPTVGMKMPAVMQSAMWHDHKMESVLASWTEMRHDTLMMVEGMGGTSCEFPQAYVEPVVNTYRSLDKAIQKMRRVYVTLGPKMRKDTEQFFAHFSRVMKRLERIGRNELSGGAVTTDDLKYINGMMAMETDDYTGERLYNGWYPRLYWTRWNNDLSFSEESGTDEPLVSDVFCDVETQTVLETATGHPGILFVVLNINGKDALYAGAASSFYYFLQEAEDRMNDADWRTLLSETPPARPAFVQSYWVTSDAMPE